MHWTVRLVAIGAVALAIACGGSSSNGRQVAGADSHGSGASPTPSANPEQVYTQLARCLRAHGGTEPDPTFDDQGMPHWAQPPKQQPAAAQQACQSILQQVTQNQPHLSASQIQQMQTFSRCMRDHGVPSFPDPDPQTGVPNYQQAGISQTDPSVQQAYQQCRSQLPAGVTGPS